MDLNKALTILWEKKGAGIYETLVYLVYRDWILKEGASAIDIGAHQGLHTFRIADKVGPTGRVFAFEPLPEIRAKLEKDIAKRYDGKIVTISGCALSNTVGLATFYRNHEAATQSTLVKQHSLNPLAHKTGFEVYVTTLDDLFAESPPRMLRLIKIDAEASEYNILKGAKKLLEKNHPMIVMEFWLPQMDHLGLPRESFFDLADELDYVFYNMDGTPFDREFHASQREMHCYERFGAKRGSWIEGFLRDKMRGIVEHQVLRTAEAYKIDLSAAQ